VKIKINTVRHDSWEQFFIFGISLLPALTIFLHSPEGLDDLGLRHLLINHLLDDANQLFTRQESRSIATVGILDGIISKSIKITVFWDSITDSGIDTGNDTR
jgi:hypothetical protein